ncbi:hypothetical protein [Corynebacterium oculi]
MDFETANEKRGSACAVALVKFDEEGTEGDSYDKALAGTINGLYKA